MSIFAELPISGNYWTKDVNLTNTYSSIIPRHDWVHLVLIEIIQIIHVFLKISIVKSISTVTVKQIKSYLCRRLLSFRTLLLHRSTGRDEISDPDSFRWVWCKSQLLLQGLHLLEVNADVGLFFRISQYNTIYKHWCQIRERNNKKIIHK